VNNFAELYSPDAVIGATITEYWDEIWNVEPATVIR
jgi:hypothetical protein